MKNQLLSLLSLLLLFNYSDAQPVDRQWLIWNNSGWDGSIDAYATGSPITNKFALQGISHPDTMNVKGSRNDLFIIYSDGQHFNSRYEPHPGFFYPDDSKLGETNHNFNSLNRNGTISYMYMTNRYESDEPPMSMTVPNVHVGSLTPNYDVGLTPALLSANHDVAFTKDITIVVNYDSLLEAQLQPLHIKGGHVQAPPTGMYLRYDGIKNVHTGATTFGIDFLDLRDAFVDPVAGGIEPGFPHDGYDSLGLNTGFVKLEYMDDKKYRYINLITNRNAYAYGPDRVTGEVQDSAIFTIFNRGAPVAMIAEPILHSHDPNFLKVERICRLDDGGHLVFYLLEFENTSPTVTPVDGPGDRQGLSVNIDFPSIFDLTCMRLTGWFSGGDQGSCSIDINTTGPRQRQFVFRHEGQLKQCTKPGQNHCIGRIRFSVKVNPGVDVTNLNTDLMLNNIQVYFGQVPFSIHEFYDLKECKFKEDSDDNTNEPDLNANEFEVDSNGPGYDPKKDPGKYPVDPDSPNTNNGNNDSLGNNKTHHPHGHVSCYRPISPGKCKCKSGPGPLPMVIALAIAAIFLTLLVRGIRRRRINPPTPQGNPTPPPPQGS